MSEGGALARARIYVLKKAGENSKERDSAIEVCFNPKEYSLDKSVSWSSERAFTDAPQPEYTKPQAMTLSVTLHFDSYEERANVRDKWVRQIEKLTMMREQPKEKGNNVDATEKQKFRPPTILFVWGKFTFKGVVESLSQKYTMFLGDGTPVRAECALKIRNVIDPEIDHGDDTKFDLNAETETVPVHENDRLDLIAARSLGDAGRWAEIAAFNGIVDPVAMTTADGERVSSVKIQKS